MQIYSTADVGRILGVNPSTIRRHCAKHGIGQGSRDWVLTEDDLESLRRIVHTKPGNPKFVPGNYFGGTKKRPKKKVKK